MFEDTQIADLSKVHLEGKQPLQPTATFDEVPRRFSDFDNLISALDYAASGDKGMNFHDPRGKLQHVMRYSALRDEAIRVAWRLVAAGIQPGERVALIAQTCPEFSVMFYGAVYAGALPVPLPLPTSFGGRENYVSQLVVQMQSSDPAIFLYPAELGEIAKQAGDQIGVRAMDWDALNQMPGPEVALALPSSDDICYLQYSSGSTRFPHGVAVSHKAVLSNLAAHAHAMQLQPSDRCISWLPFYHDMGLVGCFLSPMANQMSVDYLKTEDFARRPLAWLDLISRNKGTTLSYSPTFGYDICARRISSQSHVADRFDLARWRVAGNGADMIRPDVMQKFVNAFADAGFNAKNFVPSYGLAEATLAVTLMPPGEGIQVDLVDEAKLAGIETPPDRPKRYRAIVNCGKAARGMQVEVRDSHGDLVKDGDIGRVWTCGTSLMDHYFRDEDATNACLIDGWLDTGDMGYLRNDYLYIVGRAKDMIIINGKNHWPQDIEWAVEQLSGFKSGDIAAFSITTPSGEEAPAVLVQCRSSNLDERKKLRDEVRDKVRAITGMNCVVELVPPRTLPKTSSGKLSRAKARNLYLSGEIQPLELAA